MNNFFTGFIALSLSTTLAAAISISISDAAQAQASTWPDKPVRVVVPAPPGSSLDIIVRTLADKLKDKWKQPLVIENKAGAGGMLGMDLVAKAAPDGYTLGLGFNGPIAFGPHMYKKMPYAPGKDLAPIVLTTSQPNVLAVNASNPANTLPELVAWAKTQGNKLSYGSVGNGSSSHLTMALLESVAGFDAVHVPYNGSPPAGTSLAANETQMLFAVAPPLVPLVQGNRIKLIAATSLQRTEGLKTLPTVAETYPGFEALAWNGLFTATGTPPDVIARINADVNAVLKDPAVRDTMVKQGFIIGGGTAAEFKSFIDSEGKQWGAIIKKVGISID